MKTFTIAFIVSAFAMSQPAFSRPKIEKMGKILEYVAWDGQDKVVINVADHKCYIHEDDINLLMAAQMAKASGATVTMSCYQDDILTLSDYRSNRLHRLVF